MRHLLGNLFKEGFCLPARIDYTEIESLPSFSPQIPRILFLHDDEPFFKTPEELPVSKKKYRRKKIILMARHLADVVVSAFFQKTKRFAAYGSAQPLFQGSIGEYVHCRQGSIDTYIRYLNIWAKEKEKFPAFLLLRYEDLLDDTFGEMRKVVQFLGLGSKLHDSLIHSAIEQSGFEKMHEKEKRGILGSNTPVADVKDPESFKTRRGNAGGYLDYLEANEVQYIAGKVREGLARMYGYTMQERDHDPV
jgi:hypothetical protein